MDKLTRLVDIDIPHRDALLVEIFPLAPPDLFDETPWPETLGELAAQTGLAVATVVSRLEELRRLSRDIEVTPEDLAARLAQGPAPCFLDVREEWEYERAHIPGSILLAREHFPDLIPRLAEAPAVVTICQHGIRSLSAALYLRSKGLCEARSLAGGLEAWSRRPSRVD